MSRHPPSRALSPDRAVLARTGEAYRMRPVRPFDEAALRDMFLRCSPDDMRLRCFCASKSFPAAFAARLARLARLDGPDEFALAALAPSGEVAGVVHAVRQPGPGGEADYDVAVRSDLKGRGIGAALMRAMLSEAARRGFASVCGDVLVANRAMLALAGDLGFRTVGRDGDVMRIAAPPGAEARSPGRGRGAAGALSCRPDATRHDA